jgi:hypothetical protein
VAAPGGGAALSAGTRPAPALREAAWWMAVALLLAAQAALGLDAARRLSVTHDEYWHLPVGLLNLREGRFDYDVKNPPLTRVWSALPLALAGARIGPLEPGGDDEAYGAALLAAEPARYARLLAWGRAMNLVWLAATGLVLAAFGRELLGRRAALAAVALFGCCPSVLGHGALVTPDAGLACFSTAALWAVWRHARSASWRAALAAGALLGLALAAKFTALLWVALLPGAWAIARARAGLPRLARRRLVLQTGAAALLALIVLAAAYGFEGFGARLGEQRFVSTAFAPLERAPAWLKALPVPLPAAFVRGLDLQRRIMEGALPVFLDGEWREGGFARYYAFALAYKLPHAVQALLLLAAWRLLRPGGRRRARALAFLALPAAALLAVASLSANQLGIRYVLPVFPLLLLAAASVFAPSDTQKGRMGLALAWLALLAAPLALRGHPQHLAYFNEAAGGCRGGRAHLLDSNLDWGQGLSELAAWLERSDARELGLAYFGTLPPAALGLGFPPPPPFRPQPGRYAVSVNFVQSYPGFVRLPDGSKRAALRGQWGYFRFFEPFATLGCSIDLYELSRGDVARWEALAAPLR